MSLSPERYSLNCLRKVKILTQTCLFVLHFKQFPWLWWTFPYEAIWSLVTSHLPSERSEATAPAQRARWGGKFNSLCSSVAKVRTFKTPSLMKFPAPYKPMDSTGKMLEKQNIKNYYNNFWKISSLWDGPFLCSEGKSNSINMRRTTDITSVKNNVLLVLRDLVKTLTAAVGIL